LAHVFVANGSIYAESKSKCFPDYSAHIILYISIAKMHIFQDICLSVCPSDVRLDCLRVAISLLSRFTKRYSVSDSVRREACDTCTSTARDISDSWTSCTPCVVARGVCQGPAIRSDRSWCKYKCGMQSLNTREARMWQRLSGRASCCLTTAMADSHQGSIRCYFAYLCRILRKSDKPLPNYGHKPIFRNMASVRHVEL